MTATHVTDEACLLSRLLRGEQAAYRDLVNTQQSAMLAVAYAIVGRGYADDVVQEAWLAIVRGIGHFQGRSSLKTWMLTTTSNTAKGRYKARRNEANCIAWIDGGGWRAIEDHCYTVAHQDSPEALLSEAQLYAVINMALEALPELQRRVLILRECSGLELEDIATQLGFSPTYVRVLLHRARLKVFSAITAFNALHRHHQPLVGGGRDE